MVEIGGTNPPLLRREEVKPDNRPLLPPNYISLRQLREQRLKEEQEKEKEKEKVKQSDNYVSLRQLREQRLKEDKEKEMVKGKEKEIETDNCAHVPPNYVSLRQLQEWRLKEKKEKENGREEESENRPRLPPNYVSLKQLQEQRLKEEKGNEKEKEKKDNKVREKMIGEEKGEKNSLLPPNYISLRQLRELRLQEKEEVPKARIEQTKVQKEGDESGQIEVEINKKACDMARSLQSNCKGGYGKSSWVWEPVHPPAGASSSIGLSSADSVFLPENAGLSHEVVMALFDQNEDAEIKLRKKKKKKKKQQQQLSRKKFSVKDNGEPVQGSELLMEVTDSVFLPENAGVSHEVVMALFDQNEDAEMKLRKKKKKKKQQQQQQLSRKKFSVKHNGEPVQGSELLMEVTDSVFLPENAGVSHQVVMALFDQNEDAEIKLRKKKKKQQQQQQLSRKKFSVKDNGEPVQGSELLMEVTDLKIGEAVYASSNATKEVAIYQNENNAVQKGKGGNVNLTESSSLTIPVPVQKKIFKMHNGRDKGKGKEVNLSEQNHSVVVPLSEAVKGSDGVEEVIGSEIENVVPKGKGKMIDISELSDQTPCHEDAKGILGAGEVIGSENWNCKDEKGMGKNVNLPESSEWGGQIGGNQRKRNHAAGIIHRGHPRAGRFAARPAEHLRGGGSLVWVPKKSS